MDASHPFLPFVPIDGTCLPASGAALRAPASPQSSAPVPTGLVVHLVALVAIPMPRFHCRTLLSSPPLGAHIPRMGSSCASISSAPRGVKASADYMAP